MRTAVRVLTFCALLVLAGFASQAKAAPNCGENTGQKATGKPIPIGGVTSMSGIGSFKEAGDAAEAYFKCVNDNGGIHGRPITYHAEDDQSQLDVAAQAAKKLVEDEGVYVMIGSTSSSSASPTLTTISSKMCSRSGSAFPRNATSRKTSLR